MSKGETTKWIISTFSNGFVQLNVEETDEHLSEYGNHCFEITDDDIEALKCGKILFARGEYGTIIRYQYRSGQSLTEGNA